jgi:hypothetical protein
MKSDSSIEEKSYGDCLSSRYRDDALLHRSGPKIMKYILGAVASILMGAGIVWAGSIMTSCNKWKTAWLCRVAERVGGIVLAPGIMAQAYSGSKPLALLSDTLFYGSFFFLLFCFWIERKSTFAQNGLPSRH